ncbi:MAG: hypothetical protein JWN75_1168 [Candidatus Saccharibacteria bacterium]|nr:hypothetical protein [Candidatus Saccharibacteria bacterium]
MTTRLLYMFVLPNVLFAIVALATSASTLITVLNAALFAIAVGVCLAYGPPVVRILMTEDQMDTADWLGVGIFCSWASIVFIRAWSIVWRSMGKPEWLLESDIVTYALYLQLCAAIFHLAAPGGINSRVPTRRWIDIGITVSVTIFVVLGVGYFFKAFDLE